jgi:hypothetical protein
MVGSRKFRKKESQTIRPEREKKIAGVFPCGFFFGGIKYGSLGRWELIWGKVRSGSGTDSGKPWGPLRLPVYAQ